MRFEEFATARLPALLRFAYLLCGDRELARDLVQDALTRALVRWNQVARADRPYAYVRRIVTNEYLALRRRRWLRTVPLAGAVLDGRLAPVHRPDARSRLEDRDGLWQKLAALPSQQRAVLVLRYYEDLSDAEISEVLGCRTGTVRSHASRALATLRLELSRPGEPSGSERHPRSLNVKQQPR
jgi:RNA polymerase sigma-70 factor (sigma-E family)